MDNWQADDLSQQVLNQGEWSLHQEVFQQICLHWGSPEVDLMASQVNRKVQRFVARSRNPLAVASDALVAPLGQYRLIFTFPPLKLLPRLLRRIEAEGKPGVEG